MPFEENKLLFSNSPSDSGKIWRFVDFAKFMGLLEDKALFFCRSDRLGDDFEGHYSNAPLRANVTYISADSPPKTDYNVLLDEEDVTPIKEHNLQLRQSVFINCWNLNNYESYNLWRLYSANKGVAIQSTFGRLKESLKSSPERVNVGRVTYIDWDEHDVPVGNSLYPFVYKRNNFESENELRALYWDIDNRYGNKLGINIPINLEILVENIYIYPMSSQWHHDLVQSILKRYNLNVNVRTSKLSEKPN